MSDSTVIMPSFAGTGTRIARPEVDQPWNSFIAAPKCGTVCPCVNVRSLSPSEIQMLEHAIERIRFREN